jgi:uncharacterized protein involved in exopolysaccharide biosynthesis
MRQVLASWRWLGAAAVVGAVIGVATALLLPSRYTAGASFQAEAPASAPSLGGALAGLASQIGGIQLTTQSNAQLFGDLLRTGAVLRRVVQARYPWRGDTVLLAAIWRLDRRPTGLRDHLAVRKLAKSMRVDVNIRTGVVGFAVEAGTPELALALAETTLAALNEANVRLRQARAAAERSFTAERAEVARQRLADAEARLATFYERNRIISGAPALQVEEGRLRRNVEMEQTVYTQLRLQAEQAAVAEVRNTPAISVIDPAILPVKRTWPNRRLVVVAGLLAGLGVGVLRLALWNQPRMRTA